MKRNTRPLVPSVMRGVAWPAANRWWARSLLVVIMAFALVVADDYFSPAVGQTQPKKQFMKVPILVDALKSVTDAFPNQNQLIQQVQNMVKKANEIMLPFGIELILDKKNIDVTTMTPDPPGTELKPLAEAGLNKLKDKFEGKGYKIFLTANKISRPPDVFDGTTDPNLPVMVMRFIPGQSDLVSGIVVAHEFGHSAGLEDLFGDADKKRLMHRTAPTNPGTLVNSVELGKLKKYAEKIGRKKARIGDPVIEPVDTKHGLWTDDIGDVDKSHIDLFFGSLFAESPTADLEVDVELSGLHPNGTNVNSKFEMFFNTDNNLATGATFGSFTGIDKILRITLTGQFPFTSPAGVMTAELFDVGSSTSLELTPGEVIRIPAIFDDFETGNPATFNENDAIQQSLPLSSLGTLADQVPIGIRATDLDTGEFDETSFVFEFNPPRGPLLEMSPVLGRPGDTVDLMGTNFSPLSTVTIHVDDTEVLTTAALSDGSFSASFTFPTVSPGDHFVTAIDDTGLFDFSVFSFSVSDLVTFEPIESTFETTFDTTGCPPGFVGKFSFDARLANVSDKNLINLQILVSVLTNGHLLQNADGGPDGEGARLTVPETDGFSDGVLSPDDFVDVPFVICLTAFEPFTFFVDVLGLVE